MCFYEFLKLQPSVAAQASTQALPVHQKLSRLMLLQKLQVSLLPTGWLVHVVSGYGDISCNLIATNTQIQKHDNDIAVNLTLSLITCTTDNTNLAMENPQFRLPSQEHI